VARRVWLHVACPKTGTSFLQNVMWANRATLKRQGLLLPGSRRQHWNATVYVRDGHRSRPHPESFALEWENLVDTVRRTRGDVLISNELFTPATPKQARFAIEAFGGEETHVIVTARDLARQIPAGWQQGVKHGTSHSFDDFVHDVVHRGSRARVFWRMQDLPAVTARWGDSLPAHHVHLVTVPPQGADQTELWRRFASLPGVDPDSVDLGGARRNDSLGRVEVELLRRLNELRGDRFPHLGHRWLKRLLADQLLAARPDKVPFTVDDSVHEWVAETSHEKVSVLSRRGYDVVGDLADLLPPDRRDPQHSPPPPTEAELLTAANDTILELLDVHRDAVERGERVAQARSRVAQGMRWLSGPRARRRLISAVRDRYGP
jgi:hypothetical protein